MYIVIQCEKPGDSTTLFRLMIGEKIITEHMTAVQAHLLVGDILERLVQPRNKLAQPMLPLRTRQLQEPSSPFFSARG